MGGSQGIGLGPQAVDFPWIPQKPGFQTVSLAHNSEDVAVNESVRQQLNVMPAPVDDAIALASLPSSLTGGASAELTVGSASGHPVIVSTEGPCQLQGARLTVLSAGTCTLTAMSLGNGGSLQSATTTTAVASTR